MHRFSRITAALLAITLLTGVAMAALPTSGFVTYSKGDAQNRTLYRRLIANSHLQSEEKICNKGSLGGDIQGVISFDGTWLAFSRSDGTPPNSYGGDDYHHFAGWDVYIVSLEGTLPNTPIKVAHGYWPSWGDDSYGPTKTLYFSVYESKSIYKCTVSSDGTVSNVAMHYDVPTTQSDLHMQCSPDGRKVGYREGSQVYIRHISGPLAGQFIHSAGGCHPSWLADSKWLMHANHRYCSIDGSVKNNIDGGGDYHYGSSQDLKWFITRTDGDWSVQNKGYNCHIMPMTVTETSFSTNPSQRTLVTNSGSWVDVHAGDVTPPDVAIADFWADPASVVPGGSTTLQWDVRNATSMTLNGQTVTGSSTTVQPDQTTTYTLVAHGQNGPVSSTVTVEVTPPVLTTIEVTPAVTTLNLGETLVLTAAPKDQMGSPIAATISWTVDGVGSVSPTSGAQTTYTAPAAEAGVVTVTASSGSVSGTASIRVIDPNALRIQVNCGGPTIEDWEADTPYLVSGRTGEPHDFGVASSTDSITDPAPVDVYRTVRHWNHAYLFGDVPDGSYVVRIHFTDNHVQNRQMVYVVEGDTVLKDFNVVDNAGAVRTAIAREFCVSVEDGNGMSIEAYSGSGNDVFEAAIEIVGAGSTMPPKTVLVDGPSSGASYATGDTLHIRWRASADVGAVKLEVSLNEGESYAAITTGQVGREDAAWGNYGWVVPDQLEGTSATSAAAMVRVTNYSDNQVYGVSPVFSLDVGSATDRVQALLPSTARRQHVVPFGSSLVLHPPADATTVVLTRLDGTVVFRRVLGGGRYIVTDLAPGCYSVLFDSRDGRTLRRAVLH